MKLRDFYKKVQKVEGITICFIDENNNIVADIEVLDYPYSEPMNGKSTFDDLMKQRIEPCLIFASEQLKDYSIRIFSNIK